MSIEELYSKVMALKSNECFWTLLRKIPWTVRLFWQLIDDRIKQQTLVFLCHISSNIRTINICYVSCIMGKIIFVICAKFVPMSSERLIKIYPLNVACKNVNKWQTIQGKFMNPNYLLISSVLKFYGQCAGQTVLYSVPLQIYVIIQVVKRS